MAARGTHEPSRRIRLQPALPLAAIPDAVLRAEHPSTPFAIEDGQIAHREPERASLKAAVATLVDQLAIVRLGVRERIDCHAQSLGSPPRGGAPPAPRRAPAVRGETAAQSSG